LHLTAACSSRTTCGRSNKWQLGAGAAYPPAPAPGMVKQGTPGFAGRAFFSCCVLAGIMATSRQLISVPANNETTGPEMNHRKRFRKVAVLKGGPSAERDVSLRSGAAVAKGLREAGYDVVEIDVTCHAVDLPPGIEAAFIALHGEFGEDGKVQSILRKKGIPYTGSSPEASATAFDKKLSKQLLRRAGVRTPDCEVLVRGERPGMSLPAVVKPARQGSSIGVHRVFDGADWEAALADAFEYDTEVIVERYIEGRELTVGVVGDDVLPVVEIVAPDDWYSYQAKYTAGATRYLVPAPLSEREAKACADAARGTFKTLGCRGMGRIDLRLGVDGEPHVLELNSIPGFTETSLLPKAAKAAGMSFPELCDRIMRIAEV